MNSPRRLYLYVAITFILLSCYLSAQTGDQAPHNSSMPTVAYSQYTIPGPLRPFLRLAGMSQKVTPPEVLPLLSRNVFTHGFQYSNRPTEFLILLRRYVAQARELTALAAGSGMTIRVSNCNDAGPLLQILGYRVRGACGTPDASLQTEDAERAFLAVDSGFPLPSLEQTLQGGKAFEYPFSPSTVPVLFSAADWVTMSKGSLKANSRDLIDTILMDPAVARLYWAFSKLDPETSEFLDRSIGIAKLLPYAGVLDYYGRELSVRNGRVIVPGGVSADPAWKELVGASPSSPAAFIEKLLAKDGGWLAAYFDVLSRGSAAQQAYFTNPKRLQLFYDGLRAAGNTANATRGVFRPAPSLLLLVTRLQLQQNGEPLVPGDIAVWNAILHQAHDANVTHKLPSRNNLTGSDELVQAMFAMSRSPTDSGPLQTFMAISEIDSRRPSGHHLAPATVSLLAGKFGDFSDQYRIFSEFPELSDASITLFLDVIQHLGNIPMPVRGNAFGTFQANVGIWQILVRQGQIPGAHINDSWQQVIKPFATIRSAAQVYDAGRTSIGELFRFSTGKNTGSQDEFIELLAGPRQTTREGTTMHREGAARIRSVMNDQRLVSLDTILILGDALSEKAKGKEPDDFVLRMAGQTREFELPQPMFSKGERSEWASGIFNDRHTELQMRTDLPKVLKTPGASPAQIEEARGQLASFLRDTLVGLNYAYYEPPGAQALHNNPLFVRSHDFAGETLGGYKTLWQAPELLGQGSPAGGGAHFVGSLADLPYVLAEVEQDFISPDSVQALIWRELTPELLTSAIIPRWWDVTPAELHAIALYQRTGEELLTAAVTDQALRSKVVVILSDRLLPGQLTQVEQGWTTNQPKEIISQMMPADTFYLASEFRRRYPGETGPLGTASQELQQLSEQHPEQVSWKRLSHDFGTPHPSLAHNYGLELLNLPPMPPFSGYSSRFLAESWDSPNLYWARLADEAGLPPVMLNRFVPEMTRVMIQKIFATDTEDWAALLRAMHETGDDFRAGKLASTAGLSASVP